MSTTANTNTAGEASASINAFSCAMRSFAPSIEIYFVRARALSRAIAGFASTALVEGGISIGRST
jgi:hypothetical protein